jgi:glycosyltransferase involved in cell wall biosynthesis
MKKPAISVVLPVYNAQDYILDAVNSILGQTFNDFELIVIDDASSDRSPEIVASLPDPRIRLIRNGKNCGLVESLNIGLRVATGVYVARMDHDDIALPDRLARQFEFLEANSKVAVVGTGYQLIDAYARPSLIYSPPKTPVEVEWAMPFVCPVAHPTVMMRRSIISSLGGYSESAHFAEDYDLWERVLRHADISNVPEVLLLLRKHTKNMTNIWSSENARMAARVSLRRLNFLLGNDVEIDVAQCISSQGSAYQVKAMSAVKVIERLLAEFCSKHAKVPSSVKRDAAKRIALIGIRSQNLGTMLTCLMRAFRASPWFWFFLCSYIVVRQRASGKITIIG